MVNFNLKRPHPYQDHSRSASRTLRGVEHSESLSRLSWYRFYSVSSSGHRTMNDSRSSARAKKAIDYSVSGTRYSYFGSGSRSYIKR